MVLPAQFQLGLELTNIVNPISQAVSALGSLALVDAIRKSGSDAITEIKFASLIGRHRIDPIIKTHFREAVAKSEQSIISRYLDIVLESGAGPTVQESLKNPALFSMVIQLSALAFSHETERLANAIVEAIERTVQESNRDLDLVPDYVSLLGTVRACQQQTAAFRWCALYESVENKLLEAIRQQDTQSTELGVFLHHRCLPFPVLQALLMWLQSIQSLPENRLLHLRCDSGISTVVVWCYHVLGLSVIAKNQKAEVRFGDAPYSLIVEESQAQDVGATLMDPTTSNEPLFTLTDNDESPVVGSELRVEAYGFGREVLQRKALTEASIQHSTRWVTEQALKMVNDSSIGEENFHRQVEPRLPTKNRVICAACFLFAQKEVELVSSENDSVRPKISGDVCDTLVAILIAFARINDRDLDKCSSLPLSVGIFDWIEFKYDLDLLRSFETLSQLLLGNAYSYDYVKPAVLVSSWGWSVFLNSVDAVDPTDTSVNMIRVVCGVPTRRGVRARRVIDGYTGTRVSRTLATSINTDPEIKFFPGVSTAKRRSILVGHQFDAFTAIQIFEWKSMGQEQRRHLLGYRQMQQLRQRATVLCGCQHDTTESHAIEWIDDRTYKPQESPSLSDEKERDPCYVALWPKDDATYAASHERIFTDRRLKTDSTDLKDEAAPNVGEPSTWFFHVSSSPAARWLQLDDLWNFCAKDNYEVVVRSRNNCLECTVLKRSASFAQTLVLL